MAETAGVARGLDHVQLTIPAGGEDQVRAFYCDALGLTETPKPAALVARGGLWLRCGAQGVHFGVETPFTPQRKGHPALLVDDLSALRQRLDAAGIAIHEDTPIPGVERLFVFDPFGNRLEFVAPLASETEAPTESAEAEEIKERVRAAFGAAAESYVTSERHRSGDDLTVLVEWAQPNPTDRALDISTGGGHTALAIAPHVHSVAVTDLTPRMLATARTFLTEQGVTNATYVIADAERQPFLDASFDLVTVRIAPHHYADAPRAAREMARVLAPGGRLLFIDNIAPEDPELDRIMNDWERRRDPSHVRAYTETEWRSMLAEAGLTVTRAETRRKAYLFAGWVERMRLPDDERAALEADMLSAPAPIRDYFAIQEQDGHVVSWTSDYLILRAEKRG
ncbi:MAG TPA: methyltransferase domain-containing protein [Ktedonobacterales bacterium]|jgi:ubiquinone/menaquinone biosynthesis C-methylase UbiE/catechol 2,3-dioxygenase-like lactoylglutathione lyase family enzyme|nr:methyltransferase domain-containing protein [Ktedonobacterales bacterium]